METAPIRRDQVQTLCADIASQCPPGASKTFRTGWRKACSRIRASVSDPSKVVRIRPPLKFTATIEESDGVTTWQTSIHYTVARPSTVLHSCKRRKHFKRVISISPIRPKGNQP